MGPLEPRGNKGCMAKNCPLFAVSFVQKWIFHQPFNPCGFAAASIEGSNGNQPSFRTRPSLSNYMQLSSIPHVASQPANDRATVHANKILRQMKGHETVARPLLSNDAFVSNYST
eukprot:1149754-Pelagomonas_calceolata.AAC.4